ncbi:helix-turn-helix transcriptional regulator [Hoeflea ulvae]|uniref:LuxR family transcriptional regulator n=1 Tax=Hoeflea ulvae TaxID=2983764 RepID=A0ABT3YGU8_9HYPH|nr:LuxR family transcriptional regulator [Hoeflea ulvae]MCY0095125.1 LuxR family transcriptional regulator [Hoeflea ulvae]
MLMLDAAIHLGPDLELAVNRMDFFRLFKYVASKYGCEYFGLAEIPVDDQPVNLQHSHALHNFPESWFDKPAGKSLAGKTLECCDPVIGHFKRSTAPSVLDLRQDPSGLAELSGSEAAIIIPLHTANGKRYGLAMLGGMEQPKSEKLALMALDASLIFQRYYEVILSLDSVSGLNDREIQIVSWTSEGKTSVEIAIILGLSEHTINSYIATVMRKLHVVNRAQMVASALRSGLIS